ncbi:voltage gated chloride channel-domain-containing protein [Lactifluus subvellereus]|nr:voltage gated chloride channel-domain-containing protein [Lactifluus subvellereus]
MSKIPYSPAIIAATTSNASGGTPRVLIVPGTEDMSSFTTSSLGSPNTHAGLCVLDPGKQTFHVMRMIAVALIITFGIKVSVGIFILTLGVGTCAGYIVGLVVQYARWHWPTVPVFASCPEDSPCMIPGLYAMVGAAAMLSGVTQTTVSLAVIMFELTHQQDSKTLNLS